jgi:hypothetical protein
MTKRYGTALLVALTALIGMCLTPLRAQSVPTDNESNTVSIHVALKNSYAIDEKPIAVMTIKNTGSKPIWFSNSPHQERVHIKKDGGEPTKSELHRHLLGDFRPGDGPGRLSGPVVGWSITPGSQTTLKYDLSAYYDLSQPGDYSVFMELYDPTGPEDGSGHWLRTNTATFEIR